MTIKVAINGYGRIGRNILRAHYEGGKKHDLQIVAINDLGSPETNAHLTRYDTAHGKFPGKVDVDGDAMVVNGDRIKVFANRDPATLPWGGLGVDVVLECTGLFTTKEKAGAHLKGGAKKVIISAPGGKDVDATIVYGVNHTTLKATDTVISNASCTTNCLAPLVKPLHDAIGVVNGLMTTIHAYTNDQVLTDVYHEDLRRARSATMSMIPTKTGAAAAVGLVLPELNGKLDGYAIRVPTINVSIVDLSFIAARDTTVDEVNAIMKAASESGPLKGILNYNKAPLVSVDFNHDPASSTFDATLTKVSGRLVKVSSWYDNEWGFSNRMLDTTVALDERQVAIERRLPMKFKRLADVDVRGKRVFIRADLNVPQDDAGNVTDDTRIRASVPAIARRAVTRSGGDGDVAPWPTCRRRMEGRGFAGADRPPSFRTARGRVPLIRDWVDGGAWHAESAAGQSSCCSRTAGSTKARRRTATSSRKRWPGCAMSTSTTRSAPRIAPRRPRTASPNMRRSPAPARCSPPSSMHWAARSRIRSGRWLRSSRGRKYRPSSRSCARSPRRSMH